ncbi:MAG: hypothetical protein HQ517_03080 [SAR324 cluster bacterium]|nr:hypothetical protein [SAR324 cluster bacterium]
MQDLELEGKEEEFIIEQEEKLIEFLESKDKVLHLEPMNSFYRRLIHNLAARYGFGTSSEGADKDRHVVITKTNESKTPERIKRKDPVTWNFRDREFLVDPLAEEVDVYLAKDGSVGLYNESVRDHITRKKVVSGVFKIKMNKIVELQDDEW